jgi:vancomycin resistance protein YoaR
MKPSLEPVAPSNAVPGPANAVLTAGQDVLAIPPPSDAFPSPTLEAPGSRRPSLRLRFFVGFIVSLIAVLGVGAGGIYAYDQQYTGRILPGVRVGSVDLSGLDGAAAADRLATAFASYSSGHIALRSSVATFRLAYADFERAPDIQAMVDEAMAVGHDGSVVERALVEARTAIRGVTITPAVTLNASKLLTKLQELLATWNTDPVDAAVVAKGSTFTTTPARNGRVVDLSAVGHALTVGLLDPDASQQLSIDVPLTVEPPAVSDAEATTAQAIAGNLVADIKLVDGKESWKIAASTVRSWLTFARTSTGYGPIVDQVKLKAAVAKVAKKIDRPARDASFLTSKGGSIVGVTASADGRKVDVAATSLTVASALQARMGGQPAADVAPVLAAVKPKLTTDQARKAAPLMKKISTWTTWFPIWSHNAFGANIWVPALLINGTVVGSGETFDFWKTVGPVTRARGYGLGGAIINGHTDPFGAIGGGICSCSTTLFNAALHAGMKMGARKNHFYYINRYPLGLDATVFISAGGSKQTMSWTNDTPYPVLIRGYKIRSGGKGFVRFDLYSVPNGRTVKISDPIVKNVSRAWDSVQYTSTLPKGARERIETPTDGKDVWRTVTVYENGKVLRKMTYYSHYARITGVVLVGTGAS